MTMTTSGDIRADLYKAMTANAYVRLSLPDGDHEGFIITLSPTLVLLQAIHEWQDVGALIAPVDLIEAVEISDYHDDQMKILDFNSVKRTKRYAWVRLNGWVDVFKSLQFKEKFVVLSAGDDSADVGKIDTVEDEIWVGHASLAVTPRCEQPVGKAGTPGRLHLARGDDRVGVDVVAGEGGDDRGEDGEGSHALCTSFPSPSGGRDRREAPGRGCVRLSSE